MSLLVLTVLTIAAVSAVTFSGANARNAAISKERSSAYALAEAGVAEAMAVLSEPTNNALDPDLLPETTTTHPEGAVTWSGVLDQVEATWSITSTGTVTNPSGPTDELRRTIRASVVVTPSFAQAGNNPVWNFIYAKRTGDPDGCDMEIRNSAAVNAPLYVQGNLCIGQTTTVTRGPLIVHGKLVLEQPQNSVGSSGAPISEAHVGNGCRYKNNPESNPCAGAPDNVFAEVLDANVPQVDPPEISWDDWYLNANPGPHFACATESGTPPTFDNDQGETPDPATRNGSVPTVFHLTPPGAYSCKTAGGELSWDPTTRTLTAKGTIYIDGSARIENGQVNQYDGQATIYLTGTLLMKNSKLCAVVSGSTCDSASWNPNAELLLFIADGNGDGVPVGDSTQTGSGNSIQLVSATFQGGLFGSNVVTMTTTSESDGPLLGDTLVIGQSLDNTFPFITILPSGAPGQSAVYAYPNPPTIYG